LELEETMFREITLTVLLGLAFTGCATVAEFPIAPSAPPTERENVPRFAGKLTKPEGEGPFGGVLLLHGCSGLNRHYDVWSERLRSWGYVALQVDSFAARGAKSCFDFPDLSDLLLERSRDAYEAKSYLASLPFVDPERIALIGWSHGGWVTLFALNMEEKKNDPFRAAVAFYPFCGEPLSRLSAPLLILAGELDTKCPVRTCSLNMPTVEPVHEVILVVYPDACHCFDWEGMDLEYMGDRYRYNHEAATDAIVRLRRFLAKHLN